MTQPLTNRILQCPKCAYLGEITTLDKISLFYCADCKYSRAHSNISIFQELYLDYCEFHKEKPVAKVNSITDYEAQIKTAALT